MNKLIVFVLACAAPLAAQSLGDVARQQRHDNQSHPKPHVITNADLGVRDGGSVEPAGQEAQPANTANAKPKSAAERPANDPGHALLQSRINEMKLRVSQLQNDVAELDRRRALLMNDNRFGNPNRAENNVEIRQLSDQINEKNHQLNEGHAELNELVSRSSQTAVMK